MGVSASRVITSGDNSRTLQQALPVPMMFLPTFLFSETIRVSLERWLIVEEESKMGILCSFYEKSRKSRHRIGTTDRISISKLYVYTNPTKKYFFDLKISTRAGVVLFLNVLFVSSAYTKQLIFTSGFMALHSSHCYGGSILYELRPVAENEDDGKIDH